MVAAKSHVLFKCSHVKISPAQPERLACVSPSAVMSTCQSISGTAGASGMRLNDSIPMLYPPHAWMMRCYPL
eukprot:11293426-Karenia_brevis.AAC.1